jgi:hypothetical protein
VGSKPDVGPGSAARGDRTGQLDDLADVAALHRKLRDLTAHDRPLERRVALDHLAGPFVRGAAEDVLLGAVRARQADEGAAQVVIPALLLALLGTAATPPVFGADVTVTNAVLTTVVCAVWGAGYGYFSAERSGRPTHR